MLHHEVHGDGPAVLLVHAGIADARMWSGVIGPLSAQHRVIAPDLRGFGRTRLEPGPFAHADDLVALLDGLGVDRAAVVGASMGGMVALELAALAPARVTALALLGSALDGPDEPSAALVAYDEAETAALEAGDVDAAVDVTLRMWVDGHGRDPKAAVDPAVRALVATMYRDWAALQDVEAKETELDPPVAERLAEITVPTLVAVGEYDVEDHVVIARRLAAELPGAHPVVTIAGAAHLPVLERPDEVARLVLEFLAAAGVSGSGRG
jgi:3-oxoadipate enol-lactonase